MGRDEDSNVSIFDSVIKNTRWAFLGTVFTDTRACCTVCYACLMAGVEGTRVSADWRSVAANAATTVRLSALSSRAFGALERIE